MDTITSDFENWGPYLMKQFQQMYDKGERCDLEISCNKQIFLVHRVILSACSEYVRDLGDKQHIILPDEVSCKAVKAIIDFVYTGKIIFCKDEKEDLLLASNLLHMRLLTELIKMEESCSFTLSIDDENEESKSGENSTNANSNLHDSTDLGSDNKLPEHPPPSQTVKKKEVRGGRPRGSKNTVLPPLFKFPYLQQKFSATRTYGLITILTDFVPSRLDVPEAILRGCPFQSSFDDISYETSILCSYDSMDAPLQPDHLQFLKKIKETSQRRSIASVLFSPFDKYTPPYNMSSEAQNVKKRESTSSYLASIDVPAYKRPALKTSPTPKKSVTFAQQLEVFVECPRSYPSDSPRRTPMQPPAPVEIPKPLAELPETTAAIDVAVETTRSDIDMELPAPLSPVRNFSDDLMHSSFEDCGEKVELTNLRNVAMPMEMEELDYPSVIEYHPEPSVTATTLTTNGLNESAPAQKLPTCDDVEMIQDIPMATDEVASLPSQNSAASNFASLEQITKEFEADQNMDTGSMQDTAAEVPAAETTAVANKNETEMSVGTKKPLTVSVTAHSVVISGSAGDKQDSSVVDVTPAAVKTADVLIAESINLSPPVIPPAAEIERLNPPDDDSVCKLSHQELSSDVSASAAEQPLSTESSSAQQVPLQTETTQQTATTSNSPANTTEVSSSSISLTSVIATEPEVPTVSSNLKISEVTILPNIIEKPTNNDSPAPSTSNRCYHPATKSQSSCSATCPEDVILSDSTVFTPLDAKQVSHISTEPNSQIFAIKVKGTENQTQLSQLVDLCKKNPLFKNKNVKFKIVPVKGPLSKTLQESAQLSGNMLNRAIIVQKSPSPKCGEKAMAGVANAVATSPATKLAATSPASKLAATSPATKTAAVSSVTKIVTTKLPYAANKRLTKTQPVEKVTGPWECRSCREGGSSPLKLNSYFEYRTHLHEVHKEPVNTVFCIHCGYKSLKRNQQLYHLLSKHQIEPPENVHFPKCGKCDYYALNEYNLQKHQSTHQSSGMEFVCSCRLAFKTSDLLQQHMASNACKSSTSFSCGYCNSQFSRVVNLKAHMRVCMKERAKLTPSITPVIDAICPPEDEEPETILP